MKVAFIIYTGMTALDFIGVYDPVTRLKTMNFISDLEWDICAYSQEVSDNAGLRFTPNKVGESLQPYDMIIVPGGIGTRNLVDDPELMTWLKTSATCKFKVSVCTGSLLLGVAGFLQGKTATTHPNAFQDLQKYCNSVVNKRVVDEGDVITARGVTSAIDLGLYLCEKFAGYEIKEKIRQQMDYQT
ncbi:DJ-1/PfpI family protein [Coleofasciculus sp. FACHB-64]|uniref:DJ-1/PfpI family protein n=1 Tax=Cyanophyceae TaxID=3028117 RepID=UPI0016882757|nr:MULTISPECIES: DJ-1/PfpI family protein [unclassified Coleofasciculus]MBD1837095.1 DJ-1/PfpI family protein [Coleofasciculus sp. FACHB-501]MBD2048662.1 DJ-1/PfpI family protein [Coleofasciculus sp. FACHB-64]